MHYEHLIQINDPGNPMVEPMTRAELWRGIERRVRGYQLVAFAFPEGSCAAYYPETNPLVALDAHDPLSFTPSYKGIPVRLVRAAGAP